MTTDNKAINLKQIILRENDDEDADELYQTPKINA